MAPWEGDWTIDAHRNRRKQCFAAFANCQLSAGTTSARQASAESSPRGQPRPWSRSTSPSTRPARRAGSCGGSGRRMPRRRRGRRPSQPPGRAGGSRGPAGSSLPAAPRAQRAELRTVAGCPGCQGREPSVRRGVGSAISQRQSPARAAASVVQIWSIGPDSCANRQAPWRTQKSLILLGFRCPVVPGRRPEGPLERTFHLLLRDPGASRGGGPEILGQGTAGLGSQPVAGVDAGRMAARQARWRWQRRGRPMTIQLRHVASPVRPYPEKPSFVKARTVPVSSGVERSRDQNGRVSAGPRRDGDRMHRLGADRLDGGDCCSGGGGGGAAQLDRRTTRGAGSSPRCRRCCGWWRRWAIAAGARPHARIAGKVR